MFDGDTNLIKVIAMPSKAATENAAAGWTNSSVVLTKTSDTHRNKFKELGNGCTKPNRHAARTTRADIEREE